MNELGINIDIDDTDFGGENPFDTSNSTNELLGSSDIYLSEENNILGYEQPDFGSPENNYSNNENDFSENKQNISFGGRYKCTCGCTHFVDVGHNMCACGHHWDRHKFWND